jgi:hypothetical protein
VAKELEQALCCLWELPVLGLHFWPLVLLRYLLLWMSRNFLQWMEIYGQSPPVFPSARKPWLTTLPLGILAKQLVAALQVPVTAELLAQLLAGGKAAESAPANTTKTIKQFNLCKHELERAEAELGKAQNEVELLQAQLTEATKKLDQWKAINSVLVCGQAP